MSTFFGPILSFILLYKYWAVFLTVFLGAFLFFIVPSNAILLAAGAFAAQGYMHISLLLFVAFLANISADVCGFWLTRIYGHAILHFLHIKRDGKLLKVEHQLNNYAFGTIFLTRLAGPFGPTVNFLSGLIEVPFHTFLAADVLGNVTDITFFMLAGYLLGNYWQEFLDDIWVIGVGVCIVFAIYLCYKFFLTEK